LGWPAVYAPHRTRVQPGTLIPGGTVAGVDDPKPLKGFTKVRLVAVRIPGPTHGYCNRKERHVYPSTVVMIGEVQFIRFAAELPTLVTADHQDGAVGVDPLSRGATRLETW